MNIPQRKSPVRCGVLAATVLGLALTTGCSQMSVVPEVPWLGIGEDKPVAPHGVIAIWSDSISQHGRDPAVRGFAGRMIFYGGEDKTPVKVDGNVVVYAFKEEGRKRTDTRPDKKYVFKPEQLSHLHSESQLGHSYSFWLPWDEVGGPQEEISLIVRFQSANGATIVGEQTHHVLPGLMQESEEEVADNDVKNADYTSGDEAESEAATVSYEATDSGTTEDVKALKERIAKMRTTTITMPARLGHSRPSATARELNSPTDATLKTLRRKTVGEQERKNSVTEPLELTRSSDHFERSRSQAREELVARIMRDRESMQQRPKALPSHSQHEPEPANETESM